ncbi:hypothetical protein HY991_03690 [Candidatus Micrarchaeota archaeon]|nr:hypothetical protein [Candidatus Micrarchaeota archaeon]
MNPTIVIGVIVFIAAFGAVYFYNSSAENKFLFIPLYHYEPGDFLSEVNAFLFPFIFSLLFFGISAPLALGMEGLKYASLLSTGGMASYDLAFALPQVIAAFSATVFGTAILNDYSGKGNLLEDLKKGAKYLGYAFALMLLLFFMRSFFTPT